MPVFDGRSFQGRVAATPGVGFRGDVVLGGFGGGFSAMRTHQAASRHIYRSISHNVYNKTVHRHMRTCAARAVPGKSEAVSCTGTISSGWASMQPTFSRGLGGRPGAAYMSIHRACICRAQYTAVFSEEPSEDGDEASSMDVSLVEEDILPAHHTMPVFHVVGTSKYASRLRQTIQSISENYPESPILIQGEYGCLKDEISELIHNNSGRHIFEVNDCALMCPGELLQRVKGSNYCKDLHTMLIRNVHRHPKEVKEFLEFYQKHETLRDTMKIIMTTDVEIGGIDHVQVVKIVPLRVRIEDVRSLAMYFLDKISVERGIGLLRISPSAVRRLETFLYAENDKDLENMLNRAVTKHLQEQGSPAFLEPGTTALILDKDDLQGYHEDEHLFSLSERFPRLKPFLMSPWWPKMFNENFTVYAFAATVVYLLVGPQTRDENPMLAIFWDTWWPVSFMLFPFVGRIWCSVCPFQTYGELVQKTKLKFGGKVAKWPRAFLEKWGYKFMLASFVAILVWEQVWNLPNNGTLSAYLLLLITSGAVVGQFFYEKRVFCRYLCPIGGMNGLFTQLSMTRMKATQGICSAECSTYSCLKGRSDVPEGVGVSTGCPMQTHPAQAVDNRMCVLCMECIKGCPNDSVQVVLQIPGKNIWDGINQPIPEELAMGFVLLGAMGLHCLPTLLGDLGLSEYQSWICDSSLMYVLVSVIVIAAPGVLAYSFDALWRILAAKMHDGTCISPQSLSLGDSLENSLDSDFSQDSFDIFVSAANSKYQLDSKSIVVAPQTPFVRLGYGYVPLMWSSVLAYYIRPLMEEGGHIPSILGSVLGLGGAQDWVLWNFSLPEIHLIQSILVQVGIVSSLILSRKVSDQPWKVIIPQCLCIIGIGAELNHLFLSQF